MTRASTIEFAGRIEVAIGVAERESAVPLRFLRDGILRVSRDLEGYLRALDELDEHENLCHVCSGPAVCPNAKRATEWRDGHLAGLTDTGALYATTPSV